MQNDSKILVLVDESTTSGNKSALTVHIKAWLGGESEPEYYFLDLIELPCTTSKCVTDTLLGYLKEHFTSEFLQKNWIAFISDGASVMLGNKSGVGARLFQLYPNLFI